MSLTASQRLTLRRIDRDRQGVHSIVRRRLSRTVRGGGDVFESVRRPVLIGSLRGLRRTVLEARSKVGIDARVAPLTLSAAESRRDRGDVLAIAAQLGLSAATLDVLEAQADRLARRAAEELARLARSAPTDMLDRSPRPAGGNVARLLDPPDAGGGVFGRFGRANVSDAIVDTWAQALAYAAYEGGRHGARDVFPAIAESLWGYHWSSVLDGRTTVGCRVLDGWIAPVGDPWMSSLAPPRHWHCRAVLVEVWQSPRLRPPVPVAPRASEATLFRLLREREDFLRRVA